MDARTCFVPPPAATTRVVEPGFPAESELEGRTVGLIEGLHKTEPALLIGRERMAGDDAAISARSSQAAALRAEI